MKNLPKLRKSLYAVGASIGAILIVHGVVTKEELDVYLLAADALLGLAFYNVPSGDSGE